jgi:hypothetical protein
MSEPQNPSPGALAGVAELKKLLESVQEMSDKGTLTQSIKENVVKQREEINQRFRSPQGIGLNPNVPDWTLQKEEWVPTWNKINKLIGYSTAEGFGYTATSTVDNWKILIALIMGLFIVIFLLSTFAEQLTGSVGKSYSAWV